ncbi:MAG: F0F1 ATP synthase subunit delta [Gammaproteobacteria bacterium]|nr:F0F1 ATP synthase subunit delta [Gammaproteobacteria bacterium]MBU1656032.1 F0F1 ATP synthase subunit delta [Gammaproteobacteria bacterium]MBU1962240.1 F0F1 ATP synthase subunit delta [Gammaproteobacteria bacterium]
MAGEKKTIARPYAAAAFAVATSSGTIAQWSEMLSLMTEIVGDARIAAMITNPNLGKQMGLELLLDISGEHLSNEGRNLVRLLAENGRLSVLPEIASLFDTLKSEHEGSIDLRILTAYAIDSEQQEKLAAALKSKLGKDVRISSEQDLSLLGGVKIRAGDLVIDGSIKGKIARLATEFGI